MRKTLPAFIALLVFLGTAFSAAAQTFIAAITATEQLVTVNAANPSVLLSPPVQITGIGTGEIIVGADFRPSTGELFALTTSATFKARLYVINQTTGVAAPVGIVPVNISVGQDTRSVGMDFDPTLDQVRVVASNGAHYRLNPLTGAIITNTDGTIRYSGGIRISGVSAAAHTNSYVASEVTQLYDYDEKWDILASQSPPNSGVLYTIGYTNAIPAQNAINDMDIAFDSASGLNVPYLSVGTPGVAPGTAPVSNLYTLSLATGAATLVGTIGNGLLIKDIAVVINRKVPATVTGQLVYGLTAINRSFISFDSDKPGIIRKFKPVSSVAAGQKLVGIDVRPADRRLYALGYNDTTNGYTLYTIDTGTGIATAINNTPGTMALGGADARIGFDFNPTVDRIRVSSSNGANYRLNPATGAIAATDGAFNFVAGDANAGSPARVSSVAYTGSFAGATATTLYAIDDSLRAILVVDTPNSGASRTLLSNVFAKPAGFSYYGFATDIDFYYDSTAAADRGFLNINSDWSLNDTLWSFTPGVGPASVMPVGLIGLGVQVLDIAVQLRYSGTLSLQDLSLVPGIDIYPNPAGETLYIRTSGSGTLRVVVSDLMGRPVMNTTDVLGNVITLNVGSLPAGLYNLLLESSGKVLGAAKVVKR